MISPESINLNFTLDEALIAPYLNPQLGAEQTLCLVAGSDIFCCRTSPVYDPETGVRKCRLEGVVVRGGSPLLGRMTLAELEVLVDRVDKAGAVVR